MTNADLDNATVSAEVPAGYVLMDRGLGFGDHLRPFYRRVSGQDSSLGFVVGPQHVNLMGICHGGALMTLADMAAAVSLHVRCDKPRPAPTINLSFDFMSPGLPGRWLHTRTDHVDMKRRFGFTSGVVLDGETVIMRYSGTFYLPSAESTLGTNPDAMNHLLGDDAPL